MFKRLWTAFILAALVLALAPPVVSQAGSTQAGGPADNWIVKTKEELAQADFVKLDYAPCTELRLAVWASYGQVHNNQLEPFDTLFVTMAIQIYDTCQQTYVASVLMQTHEPGILFDVDPALKHGVLALDTTLAFYGPDQNTIPLSLELNWEGYGRKQHTNLHEIVHQDWGCQNAILRTQGQGRPAIASGWISIDGYTVNLDPDPDARLMHENRGYLYLKCE